MTYLSSSFSSLLFSRSSKYGERGALMPLLIVLIGMLILVGGLAVDSANLYWTQLQCQKAADAASVASIKFRLQVGGPQSATADGELNVEIKGKQAAESVLRKAGLSIDPAIVNIDVNYRPVGGPAPSDRVTATVSYTKDLYFIPMFPAFDSGTRLVTADATAGLSGAVIALLLDLSGSMACPVDGNCDCLQDNPCADNPDPDCDQINTCPTPGDDTLANPAKITRLRAAALNFVNQFDDTRDQIALIPFAAKATVAVPFKSPGFYLNNVGLQRGLIDAITNGFDLDPNNAGSFGIGEGGTTNFTDAFITAWTHVHDRMIVASPPVLARTRQVNYVFFSDSSPTAGRFFFQNSRNALDATPQAYSAFPTPAYGKDYTFWDLVWLDPEPPFPDRYFAGPSPLVATNRVIATGFGDNEPDFSWEYIDNGEPYDDRWPKGAQADCSSAGINTRAATPPLRHIETNVRAVFPGCLNSFSFLGPPSHLGLGIGLENLQGPYSGEATLHTYTSRTPGQFYFNQTGYDLPGAADQTMFNIFGEYQREFYKSAIVWADALRDLGRTVVGTRRVGGGVFYVVGIGEPAHMNMASPDLYQFCPLCTSNFQDYCMFCSTEDANKDLTRNPVLGNPTYDDLSPNGVADTVDCYNWFGDTNGVLTSDGVYDINDRVHTCFTQNAYGDKTQAARRKDFLLARIAASPNFRDEAWNREYSRAGIPPATPFPDFSFTGYKTWAQVDTQLQTNNSPDQRGSVLVSTTANDLNNFFSQISGSILLKLIE